MLDILALIQFDDSGAQCNALPFDRDPSTWDCRYDYGLVGCRDIGFINAISGARTNGVCPIVPRGLPPGNVPDWLDDLKDEPLAGWLTYSEVYDVLRQAGLSVESLFVQVRVLLRAMDVLAEQYGKERVRLVFAIGD